MYPQAGDLGTVIATNISTLFTGAVGYIVYGKITNFASNATLGSTVFLIQVEVSLLPLTFALESTTTR